VDLDEILYGDGDIEDDLDSMLLNLIASTVSKIADVQTYEAGATFKPIGGFG
jgi:hypothetical protein